MSTEKGEMQTISVAGKVHPGFCWEHWDINASECGKCRIAEKCADATKNLMKSASKSQSTSSIPPVKQTPIKPIEIPPEPKKQELEPKVETSKISETPEDMLVRVVTARMEVPAKKEDFGTAFKFSFVKDDLAVVVFFSKTTGNAKVKSNKTNESEKVFANGFTEKEVTEALDELL